jgi:hypothetical protein
METGTVHAMQVVFHCTLSARNFDTAASCDTIGVCGGMRVAIREMSGGFGAYQLATVAQELSGIQEEQRRMATSGYGLSEEGNLSALGGGVVRLRKARRLATALWHAHARAAVRYVGLGAFMTLMLFLGFTQQVRPPTSARGTWTDVYRYQCFAVAFWSGERGIRSLPPLQCRAVVGAFSSNQQTLANSHYLPPVVQRWMLDHSPLVAQFRTLPVEYPILSLIPFSLPLIAPPQDYALAFGAEMLLLALALFALLGRLAGWHAAALFALLMAFGAYATGADRFDLVPAALTLGALLLAERRRWTWAYVLLALATMTKFYPVLLVAPLVVAQLRALPPNQRGWRRLTGLGWYAGICAALGLVSFAINPIGAYRQVSVFGHRPLEVESVGASLVWLATWLHIPMQSFVSFGSDNVTSPVSGLVGLLIMLALVGGLALILARLWRGRMKLSDAWLAVLLLTVVTGKIFSAQYLIWVFPFVAYTLDLTGMMPLLWMAIAALTTYSYPFLWRAHGSWHATIALRNALVVGMAVVALRLWSKASAGSGMDSGRATGALREATLALELARAPQHAPERVYVPEPLAEPLASPPAPQPVVDHDSRAVASGTAH